QPLSIGVLGSGPAGQTLATGFLRHGHPVMIGSRDPSKLQDWLRHAGPQARVGTFAETADFGDLVVLSVNGRAAEDVIRLAGIENLNGKIVLDASDPLDFSSGRPGLFVGTTDSLGERIQRLIPNAYVVKGLNIVLADVMINPSLTGGEPDMFIAGDSDEAKQTVTNLLEEFGWPVVDMGGIESARWLEALSLAWVVYSHRTGKTHHAFKLVGK
ncbi:MAG TPA: NAD(P)-binding domain-containing protein, partial [Propionibacteriaceae bacterium]|nr:NAD(P)-binding domain-containing protein [Propionibacteriaceae bacterium]